MPCVKPPTRMPSSRHAGFTLIELLLVLAVIVGVISIGYSSMIGFDDSQRMARVADDLRGLVVGLRVQAMEDQKTYLLAYRPETSDYLIRTTGPESAEQESRAPVVGPIRSDGPDLLGPHLLPDGLRFVAMPQVIDPTVPSSQIDLAAEGWVIVSFGPDGSSDDFSLGIVDTEGYAVLVRVAGKTGRVTTEGPFSAQANPLTRGGSP